MSNSPRQFSVGIRIRPDTTYTLASEGEIKVTATALQIYLASAIRTLVTTDQTQTLTNKTIAAGSNTITGLTDTNIASGAAIDAAKIANASVSNTEFQYLDGVTSAIQTQLDAKASSASLTAHTGASTGVHGVTGAVVGTTDTQTLTNKSIDADANTITNIDNADIKAAAAIDFSKLAALSSANILVGSAGNVATSTAVTGDVTISNTGVTAISSGVIVNADVNAAAAIDFSKLAALTSGNILVGSAGNVATSTAVTGDVTISNTGVTTIGTNVVSNTKLAQMTAATIKGRALGAGTGNATDLTGTQATAILDNFVGDSGSGGTKGLVPAPVSGDATKYLKGDGTWAAVSASNFNYAFNSLSANTTITNAYGLIKADATSASFTITLFTAVGNTGKEIIIQKTDSTINTVTIDANSTETIDGDLTYILKSQYDVVSIISDGTNWVRQTQAPKVVYIKDVKAANSHGGTFTSGSYQTRTINTTEGDTSFITLSSNQITLAAGTYVCHISCPGFQVRGHKAKLYNTTDASDTIIGTSEVCFEDASNPTQSHSLITGRFVITASKTFEVRHRCGLTGTTSGFGNATGFGDSEVYTVGWIRKVK